MRLLPREHGATAVWLASVVLAFLVLPGWPAFLPAAVFVALCVLLLVLVATVTGRSVILVRLERNPRLVPALSSPLTLVVPLGYTLMAGPPTLPVLAVWLVFVVYTATGVAYTGEAVRAVLKDETPGWRLLLVSAALLAAECAVLAALGWLSLDSAGVLAPLFVHRVAVRSRSPSKPVPKVARIRRVGFAESANLIAAAVILALVARL